MRNESCLGQEGEVAQYDNPVWEPLLEVMGERLTATFMWMHEEALEDGTSVHAYKHIFTRRYLYLTADLRAFELARCRRYVPLRLDFVIKSALCGWWILDGWEEQDRQAVCEAVIRSYDLDPHAS